MMPPTPSQQAEASLLASLRQGIPRYESFRTVRRRLPSFGAGNPDRTERRPES